jgi:glucan phosphoethanolaminetransferase (alkaline phosphatase superfamily)
MNFSEEPVLQFIFGNMWGHGNEIAFDKERYLLGEKDNTCLDSLHLKPNTDDHAIVIILIDALRNDHLPMYGYHRNTAPFLDSLYKKGELFAVQHVFSPCTNTIGGIAGLFFSRDWQEFGYNGLNIMKYLKKVNYTTYAFLTGYHRDWFGLSALYRGSSDYYYESPKDPDTPPDDDLVTLKKILASPIAKRSFTYIHLLSTHTIGKKNPLFNHFMPNKIGLGINKKTALENNYDNGILQADYVIRKIFEKLHNENILTNSTVYILADHGEAFGEEGQWSHGGNVQPKLISVPLLIYDSNRAWYTNLESATLKDIAPTIADRLGYPIPACWEGYSLHRPAQNFSMEINSIAECDFPFGLISKNGKQYQLQVMNNRKQVKKIYKLMDGEWEMTNIP